MKRRGDLDEPLEFFLTVESAEELETCPSFVVEVSMERGEVNIQALEVNGVKLGMRGGSGGVGGEVNEGGGGLAGVGDCG